MILFSRYYLSEAENGTVTLLPWVVILIRILSEAVFIFFFISPELIRGFYWLGLRVNLPVLQTGCNLSSCWQSGCWPSGCWHSHSQVVRQLLSVIKVLHLLVLDIYTALYLPALQNCDIIQNLPKSWQYKPRNPINLTDPSMLIQKPKLTEEPKNQPRRKRNSEPRWKVQNDYKLTNVHCIVILNTHSRP